MICAYQRRRSMGMRSTSPMERGAGSSGSSTPEGWLAVVLTSYFTCRIHPPGGVVGILVCMKKMVLLTIIAFFTASAYAQPYHHRRYHHHHYRHPHHAV